MLILVSLQTALDQFQVVQLQCLSLSYDLYTAAAPTAFSAGSSPHAVVLLTRCCNFGFWADIHVALVYLDTYQQSCKVAK